MSLISESETHILYRLTAETLLYFLHTDKLISSVRIEFCLITCFKLRWTAGVSACFLRMAEGILAEFLPRKLKAFKVSSGV